MRIGPMELLLILAVGAQALAFILMVVALVDALRAQDGSYRTGSKVVWALVILFFPCIGPILYYALGRPQSGA